MSIAENKRTFIEGATGQYTATVKDETGTVIPLANVSTLTLTLMDLGTKEIVNSRQDQDVLNTNNVTYHATSGLLTWAVQQADTALLKGKKVPPDKQNRLARFEMVFNTTKKAIHELLIIVKRKVR